MSEQKKSPPKEEISKEKFILPPSITADDLYEDDDVSDFEDVSVKEVPIPRTDKSNFCNYCNNNKKETSWGEHNVSQEHYVALSKAFNFKLYCDYCRHLFNSTFEYYAHLRVAEHINRRRRVAQVYRAARKAHNAPPLTRTTGAVPPFGVVKEILKFLKRQ